MGKVFWTDHWVRYAMGLIKHTMIIRDDLPPAFRLYVTYHMTGLTYRIFSQRHDKSCSRGRPLNKMVTCSSSKYVTCPTSLLPTEFLLA
eukprot:9552920-Prorocentrum_lima.AAC.1